MRAALIPLMCVAAALAQRVEQILPSVEVALRNAKAISVGAGEMIYIADSGHHRVVCVDSTGKLVAESGFGGSSGAQMLWPVDVSAASGANVYVADAGNKRILKFSRLLEWQGEFEVLSEEGQALEPRLLAASGQGDVFVYESDEGQLLRYDPLFTLQNRMGSASGRNFIQAPARMTHSEAYGLMWLDGKGDTIHLSDRFLSSERVITSALAGATCVAAIGDSYWLTSDSALVHIAANSVPLELTVRNIETMRDAGDFVCAASRPNVVYVLDRRGGRLFRITFS